MIPVKYDYIDERDRKRKNMGKVAWIGDNVKVGDGVVLGEGVWIGDDVVIGKNTIIYPYAVIGSDAENKHTEINTKAYLVRIGNNCVIREGVTINAPIEDKTIVGDNCYIMAKSHMGHDAKLGNDVTLSTNAIVGGHSVIGNNSVLGLNSVIHQKRFIGEFSMVGMLTPLSKHLPPFLISYGNPARWYRVNELGLKRAGVDDDTILIIKDYYRWHFQTKQTTDHPIFNIDFTRHKMWEFVSNVGDEKTVEFGGQVSSSDTEEKKSHIEYHL